MQRCRHHLSDRPVTGEKGFFTPHLWQKIRVGDGSDTPAVPLRTRHTRNEHEPQTVHERSINAEAPIDRGLASSRVTTSRVVTSGSAVHLPRCTFVSSCHRHARPRARGGYLQRLPFAGDSGFLYVVWGGRGECLPFKPKLPRAKCAKERL